LFFSFPLSPPQQKLFWLRRNHFLTCEKKRFFLFQTAESTGKSLFFFGKTPFSFPLFFLRKGGLLSEIDPPSRNKGASSSSSSGALVRFFARPSLSFCGGPAYIRRTSLFCTFCGPSVRSSMVSFLKLAIEDSGLPTLRLRSSGAENDASRTCFFFFPPPWFFCSPREKYTPHTLFFSQTPFSRVFRRDFCSHETSPLFLHRSK